MLVTACEFLDLGIAIRKEYDVSLFDFIISTERKLTTSFIEIDTDKLYLEHSIDLSIMK